MKFLSFLLCVSLTAAAIVRREAEPGGYGAEPQCTVTPVKECKQRTVETPKKVCQTVVDKHEDCTETITKSCASSSTSHSATSRVTGHDLQVIAGGSVSGKAVT